jgi:3-hydroxybutyryl-CoA dehydrogenase
MRINVIGSGYMGKQISALLRLIGFDVLIWNYNNKDLSTDINHETRKLEKILKIKALGTSSFENNLNKFENNFTIETVKENLDIKKKIIESLNYKENIFSNTSSLKLSKIGDYVNGFHFMNPVTTKFIEICKRNSFSEEILFSVIKKLDKLSYQIINVQDTPGFLINKIIFKDISYFFYLIEVEKFDVEEIKKYYENDTGKINPIKLVNIVGIDTSLYILENLNKHDKTFYIPEALKTAVKENILGIKNKNFFRI